MSPLTTQVVEKVNHEIARVATVLMEAGACHQECAIDAAFEAVVDMLAAEAPNVLAVYRDALAEALASAN